MTLTPEQRIRYRSPLGRPCACGNKAVKREGGDFVCQRCWDIQQRNLEPRVARDRFPDGSYNPAVKYWERFGVA